MGDRRALAGGLVAVAVVLGSLGARAVPGPVAAGDGQRLPGPAGAVTVPTPTLPSPPSSAVTPACQPSQLQVTEGGFKVALGTIAGTYRVETEGPPCAISVDDRSLQRCPECVCGHRQNVHMAGHPRDV